jgi:hypothetical protein
LSNYKKVKMNLEKQVCTKEQSQKLYDLGIRGESLYYHTESKFGILPKSSIDFSNGYVKNAFTTAELGVMIPEWHFTYPRLEGYASYKNEGGGFAVADGTVNGQNYDTEAECRAALVIYLIENNILSIQTCNSRLLQ